MKQLRVPHPSPPKKEPQKICGVCRFSLRKEVEMVKKTNLKTWLVIAVFLLDSSGLRYVAMARVLHTAKIKQKAAGQFPPGVSQSWWAKVQENIRRSEYKISWQEKTCLADLKSAYQAPNRAQDLRTYFTPTGIRVVRRTESSPSWQWGVSLSGYGYAGDLKRVAAAKLAVSGNRIEYQRGGVIEWYVNDEKGLEQGFTITGPPETNGAEKGTEVVLEMAVSGELEGRLTNGGETVVFATADGDEVINYGGLVAKDATGRELGSRISLREGRITLEIDSSGAEYPVTIDPVITGLSTTADWTVESGQVAYFGYSVSTAGDVSGDGYADVIVGAPFYDNGQENEGAAFVYYGSASGLSTSAGWMAESNQAYAWFGNSVGTAGDINGDGYADVIVGAYKYDNGQTDEGAAFVWYGSAAEGPDGTPANADWTGESNQVEAYFGYSVGTAGDINGDGFSDVIVGAANYDNGQSEEGAAFVYYGLASGLSTIPAWTAESDQAGAYFGRSVSTAGDVNGDGYADVIVGASLYDNGQTNEGAAFVWYGSASGLGSNGTPANADWMAESNQTIASFGGSVSTAGDVNGDGYADVIVGAVGYDNGETDEGRAFVYYGSAAGLSTTADWTAESNQQYAYFGRSVSTAGDVNGDGYADVIVGAEDYEDGQTNEGAAFVYYGTASGLSVSPAWMDESNDAYSHFGYSVGTAGDVNGDGYADVIVGAYGYGSGGAAFVYHGSAAGLSTTAGWTAESNQVMASFGCSVSTAGDVNGDGYGDVIVGARYYDNGQGEEGRAFVYYGSATGLSAGPNWTAESNQTGAYFGSSVSAAGDVNGDGYGDVIVGAYQYDNGQTNEGAAFVYCGSATGLGANGTPVNADWMAESDQAGALFGYSVSTAGDINGDGYGDVIVGAYEYDNGQSNEGAGFVYYGSAAGLSTSADWTAESDQGSAKFGWSVGTAGDINGDGYGDVIVGARFYDNGQSNEGAAFVWCGSRSGLGSNGTPANADWMGESDQVDGLFGSSVSTAGDVNGDGYADVIVGADWYDNGQTNEGAAFVYYGSASGLSTTADWTAEGDQASVYFGSSVSTAGDVNGDGYADVLVGASNYDNGQNDEGAAFVWCGSASGLGSNGTPANADWMVESDQAGARLGCSVSTAGDINGDGYADVIVGAYLYSSGQSNEGATFVYYGNEGPGLSLRPRQRRRDDSSPIAHLGLSDSVDSFRLVLLGRSPFGRGKVKLQWEVKPLGVLFDGTGVGESATWMDTGTAGIELNELVSGLDAWTIYHWRVRLLYHPATTPLQQYSRWLTQPWNGWEEADLRTKCGLLYDLNGDCFVNFLDLALLATEWLQ